MRRELAKPKKEEVDLEEKTDHDKDGDVDSDDWKIARDKAIKKRMQMKKEDYANAKIKKDEGHKGDKKGGDKMQHLKKLKEDPEVEKAHEEALIENALRDKVNKNYGFTSFKEFRNRKFDEAYGDYDDDRAMAAQKAQMPASLGGKHKDRSANKSSTQVIKQKSQYHAKEETEVNEISDRKIQKAIDKGRRIHGYAHDPKLGMGKADKAYGDKKKKQADRMDDKLSDRRDNRELKRHGRFLEPGEQGYSKARDDLGHKYRAREMKKEEVSKNVSKLNKIQENRRLERIKVVADGQGGAGEVGTDELTKNYQQVTPGQPNELIRESSVVVNSQDMFKRFEDMVSYMMGISVTHPESFQMFPIGESGNMRLEYEHGPLATISETDVINFFGPNTDMEQFVEMVKEFGVNVTTAENSFVVGDSAGTEGTVKELSPGQYAEEYNKKYTTGGMMDQMRANIEALAKRI